MSKYLYGASVQGIQEFIFASNELKSIIGASELIKQINTNIERDYKNNIIINAAGNVKLLFDESEKGKLDELVLEFPKQRQQKAYGITISQSVVKFEEGELKSAFEKLEKNLFVQRNKPQLPLDMSINILKTAPKSGKPAVNTDNGDLIDMATMQKISLTKEQSLIGNIPKNKKNKTAIIHADGNGLGTMIAAMLKDKTNDDEIIQAYKNFSSNLEEATVDAFKTAKENINDKSIRDVILGGDDMTVICNADHAFEFTQKFLDEFEVQTEKLLGKPLTACAGIAFCNHKYPFHYAVDLAESLCAHAKSHSREDSSIMFHNIQASNFTSFNEYIDKELTLVNNQDTIYLNYGPYFIKPKNGYSTTKSFLYLAKAFQIKGSPISRLREWLTILGKDSNAAKERLIRINQIMDLKDNLYKKSALKNCMQVFNDQIKLDDLTFVREDKKFTPVHDIDTYLSVIDFEKKENKVECKA